MLWEIREIVNGSICTVNWHALASCAVRHPERSMFGSKGDHAQSKDPLHLGLTIGFAENSFPLARLILKCFLLEPKELHAEE